MHILLSRTQAGPGRTVKQEQEDISPTKIKSHLCRLEWYRDHPNLLPPQNLLAYCTPSLPPIIQPSPIVPNRVPGMVHSRGGRERAAARQTCTTSPPLMRSGRATSDLLFALSIPCGKTRRERLRGGKSLRGSLPWEVGIRQDEPLSLQHYLCSEGVEAHFLSGDDPISFLLFPFSIVENYSRRLLRCRCILEVGVRRGLR